MKKSTRTVGMTSALRTIPTLLKSIGKGDFSWAKYILKNAAMERLRFKFPEDKMLEFFEKLPNSDEIDNRYFLPKEKIAIMTWDDILDKEIYDYEKSINARSTTFLLSYHLNGFYPKDADLQFHFDKRYSNAEKQIGIIQKAIGRKLTCNRHHSLWWDYTQHELLYLAMHGIKADSSMMGSKPFRLCIDGKLLPIWEIPINICDSHYILTAPYTLAKSMETLFKRKSTPLVGLFHPQKKNESQWKKFYEFAKKHNYTLMTMNEFHKKYLERA